MSHVIPVRISSSERDIIRAAARKRHMSVALYIVEAACEIAAKRTCTFASLHIDPDYKMPKEASRDQGTVIRKKIKRSKNKGGAKRV